MNSRSTTVGLPLGHRWPLVPISLGKPITGTCRCNGLHSKLLEDILQWPSKLLRYRRSYQAHMMIWTQHRTTNKGNKGWIDFYVFPLEWSGGLLNRLIMSPQSPLRFFPTGTPTLRTSGRFVFFLQISQIMTQVQPTANHVSREELEFIVCVRALYDFDKEKRCGVSLRSFSTKFRAEISANYVSENKGVRFGNKSCIFFKAWGSTCPHARRGFYPQPK